MCFRIFEYAVTGGYLLYKVCYVSTLEEGRNMIALTLKDGSAMTKFCELLISQGVNKDDAHRLCESKTGMFSVLPKAQHYTQMFSLNTGKGVICGIHFI